MNQIRRFLALPDTSVQTPICFNHDFMPPWHDKTYHDWRDKGLVYIKDMYIDNKFSSFGQLKEKYNLPHSHFYRYLQVRHYIQTKFKDFATLHSEHGIYEILNSQPDSRHLITKIVQLFGDSIVVHTVEIRQAWEKESGMRVPESMWSKCLSKIHSCSINSRHQLIQFKILHRLHYSKVRLHKFYPSISPMCDRCRRAEGTLFHAFWSCPSLRGFWFKIFDWYSKAYMKPLQPEPELVIFGCSPTSELLPVKLQGPLELGLIVAKRIILREWKSPTPPSFQLWVTDMMSIIQMERFSKYSKDSLLDVWNPFLEHFAKARLG